MPVWVHCPHCDQHYQFPDAAAGKQAACPKCGQVLKVDRPPPAPMPIPPAPRLPQPQRIPAAPELPPPPRQERPEQPMWALPVEPERGRPVDRRPFRPLPMDHRRSAPPPPPPPRRIPSPETLSPDLPAAAGDNPTAYHHPACDGVTPLSPDAAARILGDPFSFAPAVYCNTCRRFVGLRTVVWQGTRETLAASRARFRRLMHPGKILMRLLGGPLIGALLGIGVGFLANPSARWLGVLEGVVLGLPLGLFVTGIVFQVRWSMARKNREKAATDGSGSSAA
ncbi:MAG TPA: hypothetical protein VMS17_21645 [Gemmataceae bacterium]|nr:hypothetical protein [Gemmataceae bacterium]